MTPHKVIYSRLAALSELGGPGGRCFSGYAPQGTAKPYAVFHRLSDNNAARHMTGACGLYQATYQVSVVASGPSAAYTVIDAIREDLDSLQGQVIEGVNIRRISLQNERDTTTLFDSSQTETYECQMSFDVWYLRSAT